MIMTDEMTKKLLELFELSPIEAEIYLCLYAKKPQTVVELSKNVGLARSTIYDNIEKLIQKGLAERIVLYKSQKFRAHPVNTLYTQIEEKQSNLNQLESAYEQLQKQLSFPHQLPNETQVRYYHGKQGLQQMMHNSLAADKEVVGYSVYGRVNIVGSKFMKKWVAEFNRLKLNDRVITNPRPKTIEILKVDLKPEEHQQSKDDVRYLPEEQLYVSGDTTVYNNIFAVCYWQDSEVVGVEIENEELVKTQKSIFEMLWKVAKPIDELL